MDHLRKFHPRRTLSLPTARSHGWQLKRYAVLAEGREFDDRVAASALVKACAGLPRAGRLEDGDGNHGVGFQIVHFAQTAVIAPTFYWRWGSVLAGAGQLRAGWEAPTAFEAGVAEVIGCVWELDIVRFEVDAWKGSLLGEAAAPAERLAIYLGQHVV